MVTNIHCLLNILQTMCYHKQLLKYDYRSAHFGQHVDEIHSGLMILLEVTLSRQ